MPRRYTPSARATRRFSGVAEISGAGATADAPFQRDPNAAANAAFAPLEMGQDLGGGRLFGGYMPEGPDPEVVAGHQVSGYDTLKDLPGAPPEVQQEIQSLQRRAKLGQVSNAQAWAEIQRVGSPHAGKAGAAKTIGTESEAVTHTTGMMEADLSAGVDLNPQAFEDVVSKYDKQLTERGYTDPAKREQIIRVAAAETKSGQGERIVAALGAVRAKKSEAEGPRMTAAKEATHKAEAELEAINAAPTDSRGDVAGRKLQAEANLHKARLAEGWNPEFAAAQAEREKQFKALQTSSYDRNGKAYSVAGAKAADDQYKAVVIGKTAGPLDAAKSEHADAAKAYTDNETLVRQTERDVARYSATLAKKPDDNVAPELLADAQQKLTDLKAESSTLKASKDKARASENERFAAHGRATKGERATPQVAKEYYDRAKVQLEESNKSAGIYMTPEKRTQMAKDAKALAQSMLESDGYLVQQGVQ